MNPEYPFRHAQRYPSLGAGWQVEARTVDERLALINEMDRETLNAALAWPDCQPRVKTALRRRLKQFDEWGYDVTIEFNGYPPRTEKFHMQGNERAVRRRAMFKSCARKVVELSEPYTREQWLRVWGDGKTRM